MQKNVNTYDNIYTSPNCQDGLPNGPDGPPNGPDSPPNGSGRRSQRPSPPALQPNQTKNNDTPTIASLGYTGPSYISDRKYYRKFVLYFFAMYIFLHIFAQKFVEIFLEILALREYYRKH